MRFVEFKDLPIQEGPNDPHIFKAVFMAGSPGAGKSTIARMLFAGSGLRTLNVDDFANLFRKKGRRGDYEQYWELYKSKQGPLEANKLGVIIDGTAKNPSKMKELKEKLESEGYECIMVYVGVDLENTMRRAKSRAENPDSPDYGRHIDSEFVKDTWNKVNAGKEDLKRIFGDTFFEVDNSRTPDVSSIEKPVRRWLNAPPSNPIAQDWIELHRNKPISQRPGVTWQRKERGSRRPSSQTDQEQPPAQLQ